MSNTNIIGAFSEEHISDLTGLSKDQLRGWNKRGFISPEFKTSENARQPFTYIYSFKDLIKLRVINQLRNIHGVPMHELKRVEKTLDHMRDDKWTSQKLWVSNKRVVFNEPKSRKKQEITRKQFIAEIALEIVISDARSDILKINKRNCGEVGVIVKKRHVHSSEATFAGTRIPVAAIAEYIRLGFSEGEIIDKFSDLQLEDIESAKKWQLETA